MVAITDTALVILPPTAEVEALALVPSIGAPAGALAAPYGLRAQLVIVEAYKSDGSPSLRLAELNTAQIGDPSWVLDGVGDLTFTLPATDATLLRCLVDPASVDPVTLDGEPMGIGREVELWINGELRWKGVPIASDDDLEAGTVTYDCPDLGWYLSRRFMGAAERRDLLGGIGQMNDAGLPGWSRSGVTAVRNTATKRRGVGSMQMSGAGYAEATFVHPPHSNPGSISVYLTAEVRIQASVPDDELVLQMTSLDGLGNEILPDPDNNVATVDVNTKRGGWSRFGARCLVPPAGCTVRVRLWNVSGSNRYFDDVRALKNDATGFPLGRDLCQHGVALINHAQDDLGKGSFGFSTKVLYPAGVVEVMGVRHMEHAQVLDLLDAYSSREDGFDWWINPQNRTIYFAARRGRDHTGLALTDRTILGGGWTVDESEKSSDVVVPGDGDPVDRPEGSYTDRSRTAGLALDWFHRPPNGTPLSALDPMAKGVWQRKSQPQVKFQPIRVPGEWWPMLSVGDRFLSDFRNGVRRLPADAGFRVQEIRHLLEADVLELS